MVLIFKSNCPKCGGHKKIRTKVTLLTEGGALMSSVKCYKCGWRSPGELLRAKAVRMTWHPPD